MIDAARLMLGWGIAWLLGIAIVAALLRAAPKIQGAVAWTIGCGFFVGAFVVTLWMRALSLAGVPFSIPPDPGIMVAQSHAFATGRGRRCRALRPAAGPAFSALDRSLTATMTAVRRPAIFPAHREERDRPAHKRQGRAPFRQSRP